MLIRELKNHRWQFHDKIVTTLDKRKKKNFDYDMVRFKSLMRFGISCFDRWRADEKKKLRERLKQLRETNKELRAKIKELRKKKKK